MDVVVISSLWEYLCLNVSEFSKNDINMNEGPTLDLYVYVCVWIHRYLFVLFIAGAQPLLLGVAVDFEKCCEKWQRKE